MAKRIEDMTPEEVQHAANVRALRDARHSNDMRKVAMVLMGILFVLLTLDAWQRTRSPPSGPCLTLDGLIRGY